MGLFSSLFQIYPEERKKTLLFSMLAILWAFASTSANVLLDGLFLEKLGASYLPLSYILGALFGCVVSFLMITSLKRMSITFVYLCVISIDICAYVLLVTLHLTFPEVPKEVWFVYRVFAMTNYTVLTTSYWSFADSFHDMQDVKRIYSLLFAAIFTGAILGSFAVSSIVSTLKPIAIFSVVAALFFITGILISFIAKTLHMVHDEMIETPSNPRGEGFFSMLRNLFSSKYAIYLTIYSFLAEVLWNLTDYNYFYEFQVYFQGLNPTGFSSDPQLIEYIGLMRALASLINIFIGLFVFSKLIKRFGVTMIIFVPFSITAMIYIPWVGISNIFIASLAYLSIEGIQRAFGDNNFHLLVHGISGKIRISYRVIIASFLEPIAMMVAGLLLELPRVNTLLLGLFAAIFAILNCVVVSREYLKAIFANLQRNTLNLTQAAFKKLYFPAKLKKKLLVKTKKCQVETQLFYVRICLALHLTLPDELFHKFATLPIQLQLNLLNAFKAKIPQAAIPWIHGLLEKVDSATKPQIYTKLATLAALDRKQALALLKSKNLEEKKAAILALCLPSEDHYKQKFQDKNLGLEHLKKLETSLDLAELSIAIEIKQVIAPKDFSFFLHFFNSKDQKIALKAAAAIAATIDKNQAHIAAQLITKMAQPNSYLFRKHCIDALQKIYNSSMIPNILESSTHFQAKEKRYLLQMLSSSQRNIPALFDVFMGNYSLHARKLAAHALHHLQPSLLLKHVENTIEQMIKSCHFNFYFAHMLTKEPAFKRLFLTSFYETLNFIIEVLGLTGKIEDPQILVFSLRSKNEKTHAHAVETIEKTTSYQIFRFLEPLISDDPLSDRIAQSLKFFPEFATMEIEDILNTLANSSQLIDQISFALLAKKRDFKDWKKEVFSRLKNSDIHYHQFAMELMNT